MEHAQFDALARQLSGVGFARRQFSRLLASSLLTGALGSVVAQGGLTELAAARKGKRRGHRRKKHRKTAQEPQPPSCGEGERRCANGSCQKQEECCPEEWGCDDGSCVPVGSCCPGAIPPPCDACEAVVCDNGSLVCRSTCQGAGEVCCGGACVGPCEGGKVVDPGTCECQCASGSVPMAEGDTCCLNEWVCGLTETGLAIACCDDSTICIASGYCS